MCVRRYLQVTEPSSIRAHGFKIKISRPTNLRAMHGLLKLVALAACLLHVCADACCGYLRLCSRAPLARSVVVRAEVPGLPATTLPPQASPRRPASAHARLLSLRGGSDDDEGDNADVLNVTTDGGAAAGQRRPRNWADGGGDSVSIEDDSENWDYAKFGLTAPVCEEGVKLNEVCLFSAGTSRCRRARECVAVVTTAAALIQTCTCAGNDGARRGA